MYASIYLAVGNRVYWLNLRTVAIVWAVGITLYGDLFGVPNELETVTI